MAIASYALVGSVVTGGNLEMQNGDPLRIVVLNIGLSPLDTDDGVLTVNIVLGREDADILVEKIKAAAETVPYVAEQTDKEDN